MKVAGDITFKEFEAAEFKQYDKNPIVGHGLSSPIIADPSVISPSDSHDGIWHMFCHTLGGVYKLDSDDGVNFGRRKLILRNAMRPDIKRINGKYYLYYEKLQGLIPRGLAFTGMIKWKSDVEYTASDDLENWTAPTKALVCDNGFEKYWGKDAAKPKDCGSSISNPFLSASDSGFRLYYSCGLTYVSDCGFSEPTYICAADGNSPDGKFVKRGKPLISPDPESGRLNLSCGCLKAYRIADGYIGLQNGIYFDKSDGKSKSSIMLLYSQDGYNFTEKKVFIEPSFAGGGWMTQYVYACSLCFYDNKAYVYFNARDKSAALKGRENIGVAIAEI